MQPTQPSEGGKTRSIGEGTHEQANAGDLFASTRNQRRKASRVTISRGKKKVMMH